MLCSEVVPTAAMSWDNGRTQVGCEYGWCVQGQLCKPRKRRTRRLNMLYAKVKHEGVSAGLDAMAAVSRRE